MAFNPFFVEKVNNIFIQKRVDFTQKKMMGGIIFMVQGKMCVGVDIDKSTGEDRLMARIGQEEYEAALKEKGCGEINFLANP